MKRKKNRYGGHETPVSLHQGKCLIVTNIHFCISYTIDTATGRPPTTFKQIFHFQNPRKRNVLTASTYIDWRLAQGLDQLTIIKEIHHNQTNALFCVKAFQQLALRGSRSDVRYGHMDPAVFIQRLSFPPPQRTLFSLRSDPRIQPRGLTVWSWLRPTISSLNGWPHGSEGSYLFAGRKKRSTKKYLDVRDISGSDSANINME